MSKRSTIVAVTGVLLAFAVLGPRANAWGSRGASYLTFSGPVRLPGVTLGTGTYVFERVDSATTSHLIVVKNRATSKVSFMGFTQEVPRPPEMARDHQIVFRESRRGVIPQIDAWYPVGESTGEQFIYSKSR